MSYKKKFSIAVDVDGIVNNLMPRAIEIYNERYNASLSLDNFVKYKIEECLHHQEAQNFMEIFEDEEFWYSLVPIKNSIWGIKQFVESGYDVYFATATHYSNFAWKVKWLQSFFGMIPEKNIICIHNKALLKVDVLIDDCIDNLLSSMWFERVTLDYPWNRYVWDETYGIHRAFNWIEIVDIVDKIYEETVRG